MPEKPPVHPLDLSVIPFPSDKVTIGQMRREQPEIFETALAFSRSHMDDFNVAATVSDELRVVTRAFNAAIGQANSGSQEDRQDTIQKLNDDYVRYGISTGLQQTQQLIRDLEAAAERQAKKNLGRGR